MQSNTALQKQQDDAGAIMERVVIVGDLAKLEPKERVLYYKTVCESVGLNPYTRPFEYINLNGKLTLYARKDATDQLRDIHNVSILELAESERDGVFIVTAKAINGKGRTDIAKGAVSINGLKGDNLANALMKAETKAKRRVTLSICGLGFLDETEIETIPQAQPAKVTEQGEIVKEQTPNLRALPPLQPIEVTAEQIDKEFAEDGPMQRDWHKEVEVMWTNLWTGTFPHPDFQGRAKCFKHLTLTALNQGWIQQAAEIESHKDLSAEQAESYYKILCDIYAAQQEKKDDPLI